MWLSGVATAAWSGELSRADGPGPAGDEEELERRAVVERGERAGLRPFRVARTGHYQAIGDAGDGFQSLTLRDCEAVAADYLAHYRAQGFEVARPARRLTVVTLADDRSFAAYLGDRDHVITARRNPISHVHGAYQSGSNRLIVFDHRSLGPQLAPRAGHDNLRALTHEATHQLSFNTGLLDARGDVPACVSEGIATYGEFTGATGRVTPGKVNYMRLRDLAMTRRRAGLGIPVGRLLTDDRLIKGPASDFLTLLAYAESWLLVYYLMKGPLGPAGFRNYLATIRRRADPGRRLEDARECLGDLDSLGLDLARFAGRLQDPA